VIRLQKVLADRGVASRRKAEELIVAGRVRVDGETVVTLGTRVAPDARIEVDGAPTREARHRYVLLNKPVGIVSTANDERGRRTVVELIGAPERLYPVGRLDTDSEGMLLLTNDGAWAERVLHPRYGHEREYDVSVAGELTPAAVVQLRSGVRLEEGLARALRIEVVSRRRSASRVRLVLQTGWRRQVRRMLAAIGLKVTRLVRVRIGTLPLGKLRTGEWRDLTSKEIADLARADGKRREAVTRPSNRRDVGRGGATAGPSNRRAEGPRERGAPVATQRRGAASREGFGAPVRRPYRSVKPRARGGARARGPIRAKVSPR
jgi:23S rRNA pseudouridine2605 synthase